MKLELINKDEKLIVIVSSDCGVSDYLSKQFVNTVDYIFNIDLLDVCISKNEITKKLYNMYLHLDKCQPYIDYKSKYLNVTRCMNDFYLRYYDGICEHLEKLDVKAIADSRLNKFLNKRDIKYEY